MPAANGQSRRGCAHTGPMVWNRSYSTSTAFGVGPRSPSAAAAAAAALAAFFFLSASRPPPIFGAAFAFFSSALASAFFFFSSFSYTGKNAVLDDKRRLFQEMVAERTRGAMRKEQSL